MRTHRIVWAPTHSLGANPMERQHAPAVRVYIQSVLLAAVLWMLGVTLLIPRSPARWSVQAATLVIIGAHLLALRRLRSGSLDSAVLLAAMSLLLSVLSVIAAWGLVIAAGLVPALSVSLLLVGLVGSRRSLLLTAALSSSSVVLIAVLDIPRLRIPTWLPLMTHPHLFIASVFVLSTGVMLVLLLQFNHTLRTALQTTLIQKQELEHTRQELTARTQALEHALTERQQLETQLIASQKLESLGTLAGGIAHDFNNLLTIILGSTDLARAMVPADDPVQEELAAVFHAATRASTLTRQLLGFARKHPQQIARIDLNAHIQTIHLLLERTLGPSCTLDLDLAPALQPVQADAGQLEQVVINLVLNARDAMPDGGVLSIATHRITSGSTPADAEGIPPGRYSVLTVQDTGVGMDAATAARVFDPFFTTKPPGRGTGLGLAMCYGLIRQHGGHIRLASTPGVGTRVQVYLPEAPGVVASTAPSVISSPAGDTVVLVVDDEPAIWQLMGRILHQHGYVVLEARTGPAALAMVAQWTGAPITVLVTDVVMAPLRGTALAQALWQQDATLRVLFVSGYNDEAVGAGAPSAAHWSFLAKPFAPAALIQAVHDLLAADGAAMDVPP